MRRKATLAALLAGLIVILADRTEAATPTAAEMAAAQHWVQTRFGPGRPSGEGPAEPPFSFRYGGQPSVALLRTWRIRRSARKLDERRTERTLTYTDPQTSLEIRCRAIAYRDFPAVEWTVSFQNNGAAETPILENVQALDIGLRSAAEGDVVIHYAEGSHERITDFQPHEARLKTGARLDAAPYGGRSSDGMMPYFNLVLPNGQGVMLAVGWTGQWAASFRRAADGSLTARAGMERTHLRLRPHERIRTPAILLLFYSGDRVRGHNLFRSLLLRHYTPRPGGKPAVPPVAASGATIGFNNVSEANQIQAIRNVAANRLPVDCWWIDAGWSVGGFPLGMGTWDPDPARFPRGLKPVADAAHQEGLCFLLWCEPERVMPGTWLRLHRPRWLLAPADLPRELAYQKDWRLLNLGDPAALAWAKRTFSGLVGTVGIDIYRHDFNMHPLYYWRAHEAPDRQGMTEIRYIEGLYDFFDTLLRNHPRLVIDMVASGGRRLDFELMRRSLPLLRTDYLWDPVGAQSMEYALSYWLPIHGQGGVKVDSYDFRSGLGTNAVYAFDFYTRDAPFWKPLTQQTAQYRRIRHLFFGDFYPLTPYSVANNVWIAWQFDRPDLAEGLVQAFRRADSPVKTAHYKLRGLAPAGRYIVTDLDTSASREMTGSQLMREGLAITLTARPRAALFTYRRVK